MLECDRVSSGPEHATVLPSTGQSVEGRLGPEVWMAAGENFGYDTIQTPPSFSPSDPQVATFSNPFLDSSLTSVADSSRHLCYLATPTTPHSSSATGTSYSVQHPASPESGSQAEQPRSTVAPMDVSQLSSSLLSINGETAVQQASEAEWDLRLSWLEVQLCQQVRAGAEMSLHQQHHHQSGSEVAAVALQQSPTATTSSAQCQPITGSITPSDMVSSAIGAALFSTSEFLAILQSAHSSSASMTTESSPAPPLTLETVLSLVTSFLRLIAIFDRLLLRLLRETGKYNEVGDNGAAGGGRALLDPQTFQGFVVAGFPVQESSLQVKLLKQMILHQFEMVEKILGLPVELRISDRRDAYPSGLLCDNEFGRCLLRLLTQPLNSSSTARVTDTILSPYCWTDNAIHSSTLTSLRESLSSLDGPYNTIDK